MSPHFRSARNRWLAAAFLVLLCAVMLLPGLGRSLVKRQQELRVLLAAREMAEGGDWLVPHFMGQERLRKPPLMYWLVAAAFQIRGSTESVAAGRAVSAVAGTAFVLLTFLGGGRLVGRRAAWKGSLVLLTSVGFIRHARLAETDMAQALCCSLAALSLFSALTARGRSLRPWVLAGLFSGVGFMIKGPASLALPVAAALTFVVARKFLAGQRREPRPAGFDPRVAAARSVAGAAAALLVFAAIAAPWYVAVAMKTAGANAQAGDEIARLLGESAHKSSALYYLWTLPARMGVWALAVPVAVVCAARRLRHHRGPCFLLAWLASSFVILSALSSKQSHYALLLFMPASLLVGWLLSHAARRLPAGAGWGAIRRAASEVTNRSRGFRVAFAHWHLVAICLLGLVAGLAVSWLWIRAIPISWPAGIGLAGLVLALGAVVALLALLARGAVAGPLVLLALALAAGTGLHAAKLERILEGDAAIVEFCEAQRGAIVSAPSFFATGPHASVAAWYAHRLPGVARSSPREVWRDMKADDVLLCSSRGKPPDVGGIDAKPVASRGYLDVQAHLFRKTESKRP